MKYSVVNYNTTLQESSSGRIDPEFFTPDILKYIQLIQNKPNDTIGNLAKLLTDYHSNGSYELLRDNVQMSDKIDYALMVRTVDFENNDFENNVKYISKEAYNYLKKTKMYGNELVINKIGNAGNTYLMPRLNKPVSLGMNIFMLTFKNENLSPFIYIYLNTKYGQKLIKRRVTGAVPLSIDKDSVREVIVPIFNTSFIQYINDLVNKVYEYNNNSKTIYKKTNEILLQDIDIINWQHNKQLWTTKNFSDTQEANRIDAEYFQPKYDELSDKIKNYQNGYTILNKIVDITKCIEVGSDEYSKNGIPFVRVSNLSKYEINENNQQYITEKYYETLSKFYQPQKGEILLSKDGTAGIAYYINEQPKCMIPCGGIVRLKIKDNEYLPEYLTLVLNSIIVQQQIERVSSGALIKHWLIDEINNTIIPKLEIEKQKDIVKKIQEATKYRKQSKQLLEIAKRGVEIAIEQDENIATDWINEQLKNIEVSI